MNRTLIIILSIIGTLLLLVLIGWAFDLLQVFAQAFYALIFVGIFVGGFILLKFIKNQDEI